jgi:lysophospholipase L1-like esterase
MGDLYVIMAKVVVILCHHDWNFAIMLALSHKINIAASVRSTRPSSHPIWEGSLLCLLVLLIVTGCSLPGTGQASSPNQQQNREQHTYVAIGASDTFGTGTDDPYKQNWANDLGQKLGTRYHVLNLGVPGILLHDALNVELPIALDARPDLVTVWLAVNDIAAHVPVANYQRDLDSLLTRLQANHSQARIAVANVPDLTMLPGFYPHFSSSRDVAQVTLDIQQQIDSYNSAILAVVQAHNVLLVDLSQSNYDLANHPEYISDDGMHPNALGYARLANIFYQIIANKKE